MALNVRSYIPGFIKPFLRLVRYRNERQKLIREWGIRKQQDELIKNSYPDTASHLIVFFALGADWFTGKDAISGGMLSVVSVCEETVALKDVHHAETIMCTMNGAHLLLKHTKFENHTAVYRFSQLKQYFTNLSSVIIHIPELLTEQFQASLTADDQAWLKKIPFVHINVMNQNIRLMPEPGVFHALNTIAQTITITTAHSKYCNQYYRDYFGVPIHKLSVWISPEQYRFVQWADKENLVVASPDKHPMREEILDLLRAVPGLTVQVIQNLTYQEYKQLISRAKWTITFGEGLDGYFIEPVFSGAVAFAVFNEEFFTPDFKSLPTVSGSYEEMKASLIKKISELDNPGAFVPVQQEQFDLLAKYYSKTQYKKNIELFYKGEYTYA